MGRETAPPASSSAPVLAILPFMSAPESAQYLGDGISQDLINSLSQLPQLKVIARTTTLRYSTDRVDVPTLRRELGVDAFVSGRILHQNDMLVVQAELTNAIDGTQIWGHRYNKRLSDIFAVQEEIARDIANNLRLRLSPRDDAGLSRRYTSNIDAYRQYLQGRAFAQRRTPAGLQESIGYYEKAIALDKNYALAFTGLADVYTNLISRGLMPIATGRQLAREAATTALALDSALAEAHAAAGQLRVFAAPYDFAAGEAALRRAIELSPSAPTAYQYLGVALLEQGRLDEGLKQWEAVRDLDPLSPFINHLIAYAQILKRDYPRALAVQRQANQLGPPFSTFMEIEIYLQAGALAEALAEIERLTPGRENDPYLRYSRAMLSASQIPSVKARAAARQFEQAMAGNPALLHLAARVYLIAGDHDSALALMNRALDAEAIPIFYKDSPLWDPLRADPRFSALLRRMGIPATG